MDESMIARVRQIIENSGRTQRDIADEIGIEETKLAKSLRGKRRFSSLELALLADLGGRTIEWILSGVEPRAMVFAHRSAGGNVAEANMAGADVLTVIAERYEGLETIDLAPPAPNLPAKPSGWSYVDGSNALAAEAVALLGREISSMETDALVDAIEDRLGIDVVITDLPTGRDGMSYQDGRFRAIVIGTSEVAVRQRYTLAHELGHILWGDAENDVIEDNLAARPTGPVEKRADVFAASFTVPKDELIRHLGERQAREAFDELVWTFGVSPTSMSWRLLNLGLIDSSTQAVLASRATAMCAKSLNKIEDHLERNRMSRVSRPPMRLAMAAVSAYLDGETTISPAAQLLGLSEDDLSRMLSPIDDVQPDNPEV